MTNSKPGCQRDGGVDTQLAKTNNGCGFPPEGRTLENQICSLPDGTQGASRSICQGGRAPSVVPYLARRAALGLAHTARLPYRLDDGNTWKGARQSRIEPIEEDAGWRLY